MVAKTTGIPYLRNSQVYKLSIVPLFITQVYLLKKSYPLYSANLPQTLSQMVTHGASWITGSATPNSGLFYLCLVFLCKVP